MRQPIILLPRGYAERIVACRRPMGVLDLHSDINDGVFVVGGYSRGLQEGGVHGISEWVPRHYRGSAPRERRGLWFRADPTLHYVGTEGARRAGALRLADFKAGVDEWPVSLGHAYPSLVLTYTVLDNGDVDWLAWYVSDEEQSAEVIMVSVVDEDAARLAPVADHWPLAELANEHVVVLGTGSIGSHANDALLEYGVRRLTLVDSDRLLPHNFARHRAHPRYTGRHKARAERDRLLEWDPGLEVEALVLDVVYDADVIRPLAANASVVVVALDGVSPRRVANHIARIAGTPAVFACVLENGGIGEIVRVASPRLGCLLCLRKQLREAGGIEPEASLDRGYGAGNSHLPMTAVGGDLGLVGQFAAKVAVATLLGGKGHADQRLPGDHAVLGLRPAPGMAAPFDVSYAGEVKWGAMPVVRPDCPTCAASRDEVGEA
jgi:hypothetical protein